MTDLNSTSKLQIVLYQPSSHVTSLECQMHCYEVGKMQSVLQNGALKKLIKKLSHTSTYRPNFNSNNIYNHYHRIKQAYKN